MKPAQRDEATGQSHIWTRYEVRQSVDPRPLPYFRATQAAGITPGKVAGKEVVACSHILATALKLEWEIP